MTKETVLKTIKPEDFATHEEYVQKLEANGVSDDDLYDSLLADLMGDGEEDEDFHFISHQFDEPDDDSDESK